jgi:hypothetical protein
MSNSTRGDVNGYEPRRWREFIAAAETELGITPAPGEQPLQFRERVDDEVSRGRTMPSGMRVGPWDHPAR